MSDKVLFESLPADGESKDVNESPPKTTKKERKKKEMTDEQKEAMKLRLAKGRETALANRRKKALAKKIDKKKEEDDLDEKIAMDIKSKDTSASMKEQIAELKAELSGLREQKKEVRVEIKEEKVKEEPKKLAEKKSELAELNEKMVLMAKVIDSLIAEKKKKPTPVVEVDLEPVKQEPVVTKSPPKPQQVVFDATHYKRNNRFL